jgi:protein-tyrosine-phosphatase
MLLRSCACLSSVILWLNLAPAAGNVLLRVAADPLPAAKALGISEVVLKWPVRDAASLAKLHAHGFRVFLEAGSNDVAVAAVAAERANLTGVIVDSAGSEAAANDETLRSAKAAHPKLLFRLLISSGKQPQMRGRLVVDRDGILQVSSPSSQPWLDTNLAAVKLAETFHPNDAPVLYDFHWELSDAVHKEHGPSVEEYALAISEAEAIRADVIIDVPESLQKALVANQPAAWTLWNQVKRYIAFSSAAATEGMRPVANLGIITCDDRANYEAVNLLVRHNLTLETIRPQDLNAEHLNRWNALVVFCASRNPEIGLFDDFAKRGGIVVLVNQRGNDLWHLNAPARKDEHSATFTVGSGEIVELGELVTDPEIFARDLRRLIGAERSALSLWNSLTTLVTGYRQESTGETILNVINYADVPDNVQVQIKGRFASVQLESPELGCCLPLRSFEHGNFTDFTIPRLVVAARVHLKSADIGSASR